ncbi:hypothetical protein lerEdw1_014803, partial [Lerista edwardsae]
SLWPLLVLSRDLEEISLPVLLQQLGMTREQFVDLCILLGCDYCGKIRGLGPRKALKLMKQHGSIEQVLQNIDPQKHPLPDDWHLEETRRLFLQPEVADPSQVVLEWREPDEEGLVQFLAHEKHMKRLECVRGLCLWAQPWKGQSPSPLCAPCDPRKLLRQTSDRRPLSSEGRVRRRMEKWREANQKQQQQPRPPSPGPGTPERPRRQTVKDFFRVKKRPQAQVRREASPLQRKLGFSGQGDGNGVAGKSRPQGRMVHSGAKHPHFA